MIRSYIQLRRPRARGTQDAPHSRIAACRFENNLFEDIAELADTQGVSFAEIVRRLCRDGVERAAARVI